MYGLKKKKTFSNSIKIRLFSLQALIIARYSGAVTVCSITNLENLLGTSPEFLSCQPQIAAFSKGGGFLCLDCETRVLSIKRNIDSSADEQIAGNISICSLIII